MRARLFRSSLLLALIVIGAAACAIERDREPSGGVHPDGFAEQGSPEFHGPLLRKRGFPLAECRQCHGDDYGGGVVGTSCTTSNCHSQGVEQCGTCHAGNTPPKPTSGGHAAHAFDCGDCHAVPVDARSNKHPDGVVEVTLAGLGASGAAAAKWRPEERRCADTYCHGAESPVWESPAGALECNGCHAAPPPSHERFTNAEPPDGCAACHPGHDDPRHLNGILDFVEPACNTCHGKGPSGAPPVALDGATSPTARGVGAHARHLDGTLSDRIGRVVSCEACHEVPAGMLATGHLDEAAPADVRFYEGGYSAESGSCVVGCHWDKDPGPEWTDVSGGARACDACHGFPPLATRTGKPHPQVEPALAICESCHHFEPATHVDGHVDFLP